MKSSGSIMALILFTAFVSGNVYADRSAEVDTGVKQRYEILMDALESSETSKIDSAYSQLKEMGSSITALLINDLGNKFGVFRRINASRILGDLKENRAVKRLILLAKRDIYARDYAIEALGKIGDERAAEFLIRCLKKGQENTRLQAALALGRIGSAKAITGLYKSAYDKSNRVAAASIIAYARILSKDDIAKVALYTEDERADIRLYAAIALGEVGGEHAVKKLLPLLEDENAKVCCAAISALSRLNVIASAEKLVPLLGNTDKLIKLHARDALFHLTGRDFGYDIKKWNEFLKPESAASEEEPGERGQE